MPVDARLFNAPGKGGIAVVTPVGHGWPVWWRENGPSPYHALRPGEELRLRTRADCGIVFVEVGGRVSSRNAHCKWWGFECNLSSAEEMRVDDRGQEEAGGGGRKCSQCSSWTVYDLSICLHCGFNYYSWHLGWAAAMPALGVFASTARATLSAGRAWNTGRGRVIAVIDGLLAVLDVVLAPLALAGLIGKTLAKLLSSVPDIVRNILLASDHAAVVTMKAIVSSLKHARGTVEKEACCSLLHTLPDVAMRNDFLARYMCACERCCALRQLDATTSLVADKLRGHNVQMGLLPDDELPAEMRDYLRCSAA